MTTSLSNITVKDGQNTLVVKANDITINGSSILATNNFVTLDTNQDITGVKTITRGNDTTFIQFKNTGMDRTVNPSTASFTHCKFLDKNALTLGEIYLRDTSTEREFRFLVNDKNGNNRGMLNVGCDSNDNSYTTAITPAATDNSTKIATTAWVRTTGNGIVHISETETISGYKIFTHTIDQKDLNYTIGTTPAAVQQEGIYFRDSTNTEIGYYRLRHGSDGSNYLSLNTRNSDASKAVDMQLGFNSSNVAFFDCTSVNARFRNLFGKNTTFTLQDSTTTYGTSAVDLVQATSNNKNQLLVHFQESNKWCTTWDQDPTSKNVSIYFTGSEAVYAPTPDVANNGTRVATTAYCNSKHQVVSALPASPNADVFYYIPA